MNVWVNNGAKVWWIIMCSVKNDNPVNEKREINYIKVYFYIFKIINILLKTFYYKLFSIPQNKSIINLKVFLIKFRSLNKFQIVKFK